MLSATTAPDSRRIKLPTWLTPTSRDARDNLFLLATVAGIVGLQSPHTPWWCTALALAFTLWRALLVQRQQPVPGRWALVAALALCVALTLWQFKTLWGRDAGSTLIVLLLALKTLELKARRDAVVIFFLGFFTLLSHFFYSQSLLSALGILLGVTALLTALVNAQLRAGWPPLAQSAMLALRMMLLGAPLMLALFVLFPRFAPLWGMPEDGTARTGLSDRMQVGQITKLAQDDSVAMRVRFTGATPPQNQMYYRGPVLSCFDGQQWTGSATAPGPRPADAPVDERQALYDVLLQPHQQIWLLALDGTTAAPELPAGWQAQRSGALEWLANRPVMDVLRYRARLDPAANGVLATALRPGTMETRCVQTLPRGSNPRTRQWAQQLLDDPRLANASAQDWVQLALKLLATGGYSYTLEPAPTGVHAADTFWFDNKKGFCEHIASAFVVLMRNLGVPARVVTGYQGGQINGIDGLWTVRQSDAHAWAEVWMDGQGWVRVDPTGAIAPYRVAAEQRLQTRPGALGQAIDAIGPAGSGQAMRQWARQWALQARQLWDATNSRWNQWVLNYTQDQQFSLLKNWGLEANWTVLVQLLGGIALALAAAGMLWAGWRRQQHDPWLRLLHAAQQRLVRQGVLPPETAGAPLTPRAMLAALQAHPAPRPDGATSSTSSAWADWLLALERWRYAPAGDAAAQRAALQALRQQWRQLPRLATTSD